MNCYQCLAEAGDRYHPAFAVCQRCGAGVCEVHLVKLATAPAAGLAGNPGCMLICSRCNEPLPLKKPSDAVKSMKFQSRMRNFVRKGLWRWLSGQQSSALPEPDQAVKAVEQFLHRQRN